MRIEPSLKEWLTAFASYHRVKEAHVIRDLLEALREGRVHIRPRDGVSAFPGEAVLAGDRPEFPLLIAYPN